MAISVLLEIPVPSAMADAVADELWALGATGIETRDGVDDHAVLAAGFPTAQAAHEVAAELGARYPVRLVEVDDAEWRDIWRQYAQPVTVGSLVIAPAWRTVSVGAGRQVVHIDPGPCFGSGSHPTTRLLLNEIQRRLQPGDRVLDVGTGSGILAVAAALLGAIHVTAIDIDPEALTATRANARHNGVADRISGSTQDLRAVGTTFPMVLANLTAGVLAELAHDLVASVAPGGLLLVSGLLDGQWRHVAGRFAPLTVIDLPELDGWTGAVLANFLLCSHDHFSRGADTDHEVQVSIAQVRREGKPS